MDKGFKASILWGEGKEECSAQCEHGSHSADAALNQALDPGYAKRRA